MRTWLEEIQINYFTSLNTFFFQNSGSEVTEEDISNIDGMENVIEQRYGGVDDTDEELVGYFHNILQN